MNIAIIGGGISGLATAFYLNRELKNAKISIFESDTVLGGKAKTRELQGFRVEEGVNGFLSSKQESLDFAHESGNDEIILKSNDAARKRFIYHKDTLHRMPENPKDFLASKLLSFGGKLRVAGEFFTPAKKDDSLETLYEFGVRRVGREFTEVFLDAMSAGIFGSTPKALCVNAAFPLVCELEREHGGLFKGMIKRKKKQAGPSGVLTSFKEGMSQLIYALEHSLNADIHKNCPVKTVEKTESGYRVTSKNGSEEFDAVILATPASESAALVEGFGKDLGEKLREIEYSPMAVVALGYDSLDHELDGFGLLTTSASKLDILGVLWDSSVFEGRAPKGKKLLRVMIGGQRDKELVNLEQNELIDIAKEGVFKTMGVRGEESLVFVKKWSEAIPNYGLAHPKLREKIFELADEHKGLYLNSNAYYGVAFNDCIKNSLLTAKRVASEAGAARM